MRAKMKLIVSNGNIFKPLVKLCEYIGVVAYKFFPRINVLTFPARLSQWMLLPNGTRYEANSFNQLINDFTLLHAR
jgi:hypothetical protein